MKLRDTFCFFKTLASDPRGVSAIAPSSQALAELIASEITAASSPIVELGPGTGVFTRALLARGIKEQDLTLVECQAEFVKHLRERFPQARVLAMDAGRLHRQGLFQNDSVGAIVSGLPLLSMSPKKTFAILTASFSCIRPHGAFYQFTYSPRCPVPRAFLDRLGLKATCLGHALTNLPPAAVYRITRRMPFRLSLA